MRSDIEPNGDFVDKWLNARRKEGELDQQILVLIEQHLKANGNLDQNALLESLLTYSDKLGESNDSN